MLGVSSCFDEVDESGPDRFGKVLVGECYGFDIGAEFRRATKRDKRGSAGSYMDDVWSHTSTIAGGYTPRGGLCPDPGVSVAV